MELVKGWAEEKGNVTPIIKDEKGRRSKIRHSIGEPAGGRKGCGWPYNFHSSWSESRHRR
jgi:hypothetical protein